MNMNDDFAINLILILIKYTKGFLIPSHMGPWNGETREEKNYCEANFKIYFALKCMKHEMMRKLTVKTCEYERKFFSPS